MRVLSMNICWYQTEKHIFKEESFFMVQISKTASRSCLLCYILFAVLFTPTACSQPVSTIPKPHSPSLASLRQAGEAKCLQPPSNVDFQTSTDQQLISWGLPT